MHEWALAESVVRSVETNDELKGKRIKILLGELQSIDKEIFNFAIAEIMKQKNLSFEYEIENVSALFECRGCGFRFTMKDIKLNDEKERENIHFIPEMVKAFTRCPRCMSVDFDIVDGRGVSLAVETHSKEVK